MSAADAGAVPQPRQVRLAIWIFWCAFVASWALERAMLFEILVRSPSILAIFAIKLLLYAALTVQLLRGARWARTVFAVLLGIDAVDTLLDAWLLISIPPPGSPRVSLLVGNQIAFDAVYAYAVFLLFSEPATAWFAGVRVSDGESRP